MEVKDRTTLADEKAKGTVKTSLRTKTPSTFPE